MHKGVNEGPTYHQNHSIHRFIIQSIRAQKALPEHFLIKIPYLFQQPIRTYYFSKTKSNQALTACGYKMYIDKVKKHNEVYEVDCWEN